MPAHRSTVRGGIVAAGVTGLLVAAVALACRAPGVLFADAGELLTAVASKGIAHPPGFPLYAFSIDPFVFSETISLQPPPIPEPGTLLLLGMGLAGMTGLRWVLKREVRRQGKQSRRKLHFG